MRTAILCCLLVASAARAGRDVPVEKLPAAAVDAVKERYPDLRIVSAETDTLTPDGRRRTELTFELTCIGPDREVQMLVTAKGEILPEEFEVRPRGGRALKLAADDVATDLAALAAALEERFAYVDANGVDLARALKAVPRRACDRSDFAVEVQKVMAHFLDGHAQVSDLPSGGPYLPFLIEAIGGRFVAFRPDRGGFLADGYPWIEKIDGRPLPGWVEKLAAVVPEGSSAFRTREALRWLRRLSLCRAVAGDRERAHVEVVVRAADGRRTRRLKLPLADRSPLYGPWPRRVATAAPSLEDGVAYLPLPRMDKDAARRVREWLPRFADARALVVDVRGNGGGTREALLALHPWLMAADEPPCVLSVAKHRACFPADHLAARFMVRADDPRLDPAAHDAAQAFLAGFTPEWTPPAARFSEWHVLLGVPGAGRFAGRVLVLMDDRCFSATDIFLGALKGRPGVTLVGRPSGGGSGCAREFTLPRSGLRVRCASMASFTPEGRLYDRHGIAPDVPVEVTPAYFLEGGPDEILEAALRTLG